MASVAVWSLIGASYLSIGGFVSGYLLYRVRRHQNSCRDHRCWCHEPCNCDRKSAWRNEPDPCVNATMNAGIVFYKVCCYFTTALWPLAIPGFLVAGSIGAVRTIRDGLLARYEKKKVA